MGGRPLPVCSPHARGVSGLLPQVLHNTLNIYSAISTLHLEYFYSDFYNTAARIIVLLEETCNMFIDMARKFLDPGSIFQIEASLQGVQFV